MSSKAKRVYIMTDLEGISGIVDAGYMDMAGDYYRSARRLLMNDTNAAIAGCLDAGADEVVVKDGHFKGVNFITELLDPRARVDARRTGWIGILDGSFDATLMVGQHAMAGTLDGFLDHTMSPDSWFEYSLNGRPVGEIGMWATMAGHYKVPLVYLAGDQAACGEAEALLPGIVTTAVKVGRGRSRAMGMHPDRAAEAIRRDVARALSGKPRRPLVWKKPLTVQLTMMRSDMADSPGRSVQRIDARTLRKKAKDQLDIMM